MNLYRRFQKWFQGHGTWYYICPEGETPDEIYQYPIFRIRPFFAWYDMWVGLYVDRKARQVYFFPLPMIGFQIGYQKPK